MIDGKQRQFEAVGGAQFVEDVGEMALHRLFRNGEFLRDIHGFGAMVGLVL